MNLIIIIGCIWGASALIRMAKDKRRQREAERRYAEQRKVEQMVREDRQRRAEETAARIALEAEQMRQRREQERLAREQEKQAKAQAAAWDKQRREDEHRDAQLAKHDERLLKLEHKKELAIREEDRCLDEIISIKSKIRAAENEIAFSSQFGLKAPDKQAKLEKLQKQLFDANTKLIKAQQAQELCEMQMSA